MNNISEDERLSRKQKKRRKKSSAYGFVGVLAILLAIMVYASNPNNWFLALMILLLGIGIALSGQ